MSDETETVRGHRVADFNFDLPAELIAQQPPAERGSSRMLIMDRASGALRDGNFADLPSLLNPGDLLVLNDSRVIPARLFARRVPRRAPSFRRFSGQRVRTHESKQQATHEQPGGQIEVLLTEPAGENRWLALVKPAKRVAVGEKLRFFAPSGTVELEAEVIARGDFGERLLAFTAVDNFFAVLDRIGHIPLPPYIRRKDADIDRERYQTVFSHERGSVAAPTAGLHFTPQIIEALSARGIEIAQVTLHVGLGTFAPLRVDLLNQVSLHSERFTISPAAAGAVNRAIRDHSRIVAVGTTVVRALESAARSAPGREILPQSSTTDIFISPGFEFRLINGLLTNFHLPQSSLLMLVSAFAGRERVLAAYRYAVEQQYRFFSYGDCMFIA